MKLVESDIYRALPTRNADIGHITMGMTSIEYVLFGRFLSIFGHISLNAYNISDAYRIEMGRIFGGIYATSSNTIYEIKKRLFTYY